MIGTKLDIIFDNYTTLNGGVLLLGLIYFSFQIYCDFSGYSDIAIGTSKLFGFELMSNFKFPYFSRDIGEFWRRWHISLSTWFRDYLYIPLGGSRDGKWLSIRNIFIIFVVSGFWHGANWTFIMWGLTHAIFYIPLFLRQNNRKYTQTVVAYNKWLPTIKEVFQMFFTFFFTMIAWVFFRSESISNGFNYLILMVNYFSFPTEHRLVFLIILFFLIFDWLFRENERDVLNFSLSEYPLLNRLFNYSIYYIMIILILRFLKPGNSFIYFQF